MRGKDFCIESDHNRNRLTSAPPRGFEEKLERWKPAQQFLPKAAYEDIAKKFENSLQTSKPLKYKELAEELRRLMRKHKVHSNSREGVRRKGWWDQEVRKALDERREENQYERIGDVAEGSWGRKEEEMQGYYDANWHAEDMA
ncbi:hypothetical protein MRX96_013636 [Rhipicephalus microplus]